MRRRAGPLGPVAAATALAAAVLSACGGSGGGPRLAQGLAHWRQALHVKQVLDVTPARPDGRAVVAADGRLSLLRPGGRLLPFARGRGGYATRRGLEPYIALSSGQAVDGAGCRFPRETVYALEPRGRPGIVAVDAAGRARRFVSLPGRGLLNGIAFDTTGRFEHRLLVTRTDAGRTTVLAVDCRGAVRTLTRAAPRLEGGLAVAPAGFGKFAGQLIAPDEKSGRILAVAPSGRARLLADSGLPSGGDIGVESAGFVPERFGAEWTAYLADRATRGNPHPGDDAILALDGGALLRAGVRAGDLLVAAEAGAKTVALRCRTSCSVRHIADGPRAAHAEGHIAFVRVR